MKNFNANRERGEASGSTMLVAVLMTATWFSVGAAVGRSLEHSEERVHDVQIHNSQLVSQLHSEYPTMSGLILKDGEDRTFTFNATDPGGNLEACSGAYELTDNRAVAVGNIACTQTFKVG